MNRINNEEDAELHNEYKNDKGKGRIFYKSINIEPNLRWINKEMIKFLMDKVMNYLGINEWNEY